jgi:cysteine desulfurase
MLLEPIAPMQRIYLDWNATTPLDPRVLDRMVPYLQGHFGNPSSLHEPGRIARRAVDEAREAVASAIGAEARELIFCSGATEANNLAIQGLAADRPGALVVSAIEHPSILEAAAAQKKSGREVVTLGVTREGVIDLGALEDALGRRPALVAIMAVNNETGIVQPVDQAADLCARTGTPLHVDAVHALGKHRFDVTRAGIASASLSAHKIGGPKGVGALFLRSGLRIERALHGGGQERGRRAGTENVAAIAGFGLAAELARDEGPSRRARLETLEARLLGDLRSRRLDFVVHGESAPLGRIPGTLSVRFPGFSGEGMLFGLDLLGISVSLSSACSSGAAKPSHVLSAMGVPLAENLETVRISLGWTLDEADMTATAAAIAEVLGRRARSSS